MDLFIASPGQKKEYRKGEENRETTVFSTPLFTLDLLLTLGSLTASGFKNCNLQPTVMVLGGNKHGEI